MSEISTHGALRVLHTADFHLGRTFSNWDHAGPLRQQDLLETLEEIEQIARHRDVHLVLLAGDQFDRHNPEGTTTARFHGWLDRLSQAGVQVAMISGNHDSYWYEDSIYRQRLPANIVLFREPACEEPLPLMVQGQTVWLYGIAHDHTQHRDVLPGFRRRADNDVHIGLMHATVDSRPDFDVADRYLPLAASDLVATGLDYIALGHIHSARVINPGQPGMAAYPGSPEPLSTDEYGQRSVALLTFRGGPPEIEQIPCGKRLARRLQIDTSDLGQDEVADQIASHADTNLILTVLLTGAPRELPDTAALESRLSQRFCYLQVTDRTSVVDAGYVRRIEDENTIRGHFVRQLRNRINIAESDENRAKAEMALQLGLIELQRASAE